MKLFSFAKPRPNDRFALALDIGTEFVKALVFEAAGAKGVIKGVGRQRQKLSDMQGGTVTDIKGVLENCEAAIERAAEAAGHLPEQVIIGIAGELVKGTTTTIRYKRSAPLQNITLVELKEIIERVQRRAFERARTVLAWETGHEEIDVRLVNAAITDVRIDGYRVTNPLGFQGKEVEIGVYNAFAPVVQLGALQTIAQELELDLLAIAAEPYAVAKCLGPDESMEISAIFMDIGGGTTDIAVVKNGGVAGTKMFAFGGRTFTKRIANLLHLPFEQAEEIKLAYVKGELKKEELGQIKTAMELDSEVWKEGANLTLGEFANVELLPNRILLCGGGSNLPEIVASLKEKEWPKNLPFSKKPTVHHLHPTDVRRLRDETGLLTDAADVTPMALANLAIELVGSETVMEGILRRVVGAIAT